MAVASVSFYLPGNQINVSEDQGLLTVWVETYITDTNCVLSVVLPLWTINHQISVTSLGYYENSV